MVHSSLLIFEWYVNELWVNEAICVSILSPIFSANSAISGAEAPEGSHPGPQRGRGRHCIWRHVKNDLMAIYGINNETMTLTMA